ncbi:MAG: hypothetical protein LBM98_11600 [Oscillospiraceae bacterium]|nr:hypothetical protein [Oscillospiraceae bacterium]
MTLCVTSFCVRYCAPRPTSNVPAPCAEGWACPARGAPPAHRHCERRRTCDT